MEHFLSLISSKVLENQTFLFCEESISQNSAELWCNADMTWTQVYIQNTYHSLDWPGPLSEL